jgi:TPR repeat protein
MKLKAWTTAWGLALCLFAQPLTAGQFEDALAAHERADYATALRLWKELAEQGHVEAQYRLGAMYAEGQGVPQDDSEAVKWHRRAAGLGRHALAQLYLGRLHEMGRGVPQNHALAMKWYRLAAGQGDATAQMTLALIYAAGRGVPQNYWQAVKWYGLAAEQGDAVAQNALGLIYQEGRGGLPQDYVQALFWFSVAAEASEEEAARNRDSLARRMTSEQVVQAQKLAADWVNAKAQEKAAKCQTSDLGGCK